MPMSRGDTARPATLDPGFAWPAHEDFTHTWDALHRGAGTLDLVHARAHWAPEHEVGDQELHEWLATRRGSTRFYASAIWGRGRWELEPIAVLNDYGLWFEGACEQLSVEERGRVWLRCGEKVVEILALERGGSLHGEAWSDHAYAQTLIAFEGPAYAEQREGGRNRTKLRAARRVVDAAARRGERGLSAAKRGIESLLRLGEDGYLGSEVAYLEQHEPEGELLGRLYANYQPHGRCSQDRHPEYTAARYASYCTRMHRLGCALEVHVELMAKSFDRVAWSEWTEQLSDSGSGPITQLGLDDARFMFGILWQFDTLDEHAATVWPRRWARAVRESGMDEKLLPQLQVYVEDPRLDPANRLVATIALFELERGPAPELDGQEAEEVEWDRWKLMGAVAAAKLEGLELEPLARAWLREPKG